MTKRWIMTMMAGVLACLFTSRGISETTSGLVLSDSLDARGTALGDAQAGLADVAAYQVNPAVLAGVSGQYASAFFKPEPLGLSTGSLRYAQAFGFGTIAGQFVYRSMGDMDFVTSSGEEKTVSAGSDLVMGVSYGRQAYGPVDAGITVKMISSKLVEKYSAFGFAADFGTTVKLPFRGATAGVSVRNIGSGLKYNEKAEPLPSEFRAGGSYVYDFGQFGNLVSLDAIYGLGNKLFAIGAGVESTWNKLLSVRLGYQMGSDLKGFAAGLGFNWQDSSLDYSVQPMAESIGLSHSISISYRFSGKPAAAARSAASPAVSAPAEETPEPAVAPKPAAKGRAK